MKSFSADGSLGKKARDHGQPLQKYDGMFRQEVKIGKLVYICDLGAEHSAVSRAPDLKVRGTGFDTRSGHILLFLPPLIQEGQLSVTGESMCTKHWLTT